MSIKNTLYILFLWLGMLFANDSKYMTREGFASFFSHAPLEDIYAENNTVSCMLNTQSGEIAFIIPIKEFQFEKSLMKEHFNENYLESDLFPTSTFVGKIESWNEIKGLDSSKVTVSGDIMIHGYKKTITENGLYKKSGDTIIGETTFHIKLEDFGIKIPTIVFKNIAEIVDVTIRVELKGQK